MLIFWGISPFQNSLFAQSTVRISRSALFQQSSNISFGQDHLKQISSEFLLTAYNIAWNKKGPPSFTTDTAAYIGAHPRYVLNGSETRWIFPSTRFFATLDCQLAFSYSFDGVPYFSDGDKCYMSKDNINRQLDPVEELESSAGAYEINEYGAIAGGPPHLPSNSYFKLEGDCASGNQSKVTLGWAQHSMSNPSNDSLLSQGLSAIALFCIPKYSGQSVMLTTTNAGEITAVQDLAQSYELKDGFNATGFEEMLLNYQENDQIPYMPPTADAGNIRNPVGLAGYGMGLTASNSTDYLNHSVLKTTYEAGFKLIFAMAVSSHLKLLSGTTTVEGIISVEQQGVVIVDAFAILLIASLTIIFFLGLLLLLINVRRTNNLRSDPSSITHIMSLTSESPQLLYLLRSRTTFSQTAAAYYLSLQDWTVGAPYRLDILSLHRTREKLNTRETTRKRSPLEASAGFGFGFLIFISGVLGFGTYLWQYAIHFQGEYNDSRHSLGISFLQELIQVRTANHLLQDHPLSTSILIPTIFLKCNSRSNLGNDGTVLVYLPVIYRASKSTLPSVANFVAEVHSLTATIRLHTHSAVALYGTISNVINRTFLNCLIDFLIKSFHSFGSYSDRKPRDSK